MREIVKDIFTWPQFSPQLNFNFNGFLILRPEGNLCVDPAEPTDEVMEEIARRGVARILLTNRNHVRATNRVHARTGARVAIHHDDAAYARGQGAELDDELSVGSRAGPFTVVGVPGKSPGEVALHWPERRLLIVGDAVIGNPPGRCGLFPDKVFDNPVQLRTSVRALLALDFDTMLMGDGESIIGGAKERLSELLETFPK